VWLVELEGDVDIITTPLSLYESVYINEPTPPVQETVAVPSIPEGVVGFVEVTEIERVQGGGSITMVQFFVAFWVQLSDTMYVKEKLPATLGVPVILPVLGFNTKSGGSVDGGSKDQV
jgi:hypothetical protein